MNDILKRRLAGLAVLLALVFMLSWLLPRQAAAPGENDVPGTTLPLQPNPPAGGSPAAAQPAVVPAAPEVTEPPPPEHAPARPAAAPPPAEPAASKPGPAPAPKAEPTLPSLKLMLPPVSKPLPQSPPSTSRPAAAAQSRLWYVQIGSFAGEGNAKTTLELLQNIGYRGESRPMTGPGGSTLYRVRLGPFGSEAAARQAFDKVTHQGYPQARLLSEGGERR